MRNLCVICSYILACQPVEMIPTSAIRSKRVLFFRSCRRFAATTTLSSFNYRHGQRCWPGHTMGVTVTPQRQLLRVALYIRISHCHRRRRQKLFLCLPVFVDDFLAYSYFVIFVNPAPKTVVAGSLAYQTSRLTALFSWTKTSNWLEPSKLSSQPLAAVSKWAVLLLRAWTAAQASIDSAAFEPFYHSNAERLRYYQNVVLTIAERKRKGEGA